MTKRRVAEQSRVLHRGYKMTTLGLAARSIGYSVMRTDSHLMQLHPSFLRQLGVQSTSPHTHTHAPRAALRRFKCQGDASVRLQQSFLS